MTRHDILERIDVTLDDYDTWHGHSPDAARWAEGEWIDARTPGPRFPQRVIVGMDPASQHVNIQILPETHALVAALRQLIADMAAIKRQAEARTGKSWAYLVQRAERPQAAAERTSSPRRRAGNRRTKRHARRRL